MAAQEGHSEVVKFLLANGANQSLATAVSESMEPEFNVICRSKKLFSHINLKLSSWSVELECKTGLPSQTCQLGKLRISCHIQRSSFLWLKIEKKLYAQNFDFSWTNVAQLYTSLAILQHYTGGGLVCLQIVCYFAA